jgi:hypothetical protein
VQNPDAEENQHRGSRSGCRSRANHAAPRLAGMATSCLARPPRRRPLSEHPDESRSPRNHVQLSSGITSSRHELDGRVPIVDERSLRQIGRARNTSRHRVILYPQSQARAVFGGLEVAGDDVKGEVNSCTRRPVGGSTETFEELVVMKYFFLQSDSSPAPRSAPRQDSGGAGP